ncbi:type VII secretion-associated serine protease mycosin [Streptomyces sp. ODS28]|uniref:type VII secretion-associated serine protease mycosin n=1 Tax=Streptomyces sp. ODS28 TaxID=3136688 RepID=UPI0031EF3929
MDRFTRRTRVHKGLALVAATAMSATGLTLVQAPPAAADGTGQCTFPSKPYKGRPWSLQRLMFDQLWKDTKGKRVTDGRSVKVAVIDTGVDVKNPQLKSAVESGSGLNVLPKKPKKDKYGEAAPRGKDDGTSDAVGHGTKVAGIIAARPSSKTGFVGIAPDAKIIPIIQNDANGSGDAGSLAKSIDHAVAKGADVINISQDTAQAMKPTSSLAVSVRDAVKAGKVVVASAGNDGLGGKVKETYPAAFPDVLAVAASDRNNERAPFSQSGDFVGLAAPGVDMVSTVPKGGHCPDNGTSFAAPYAAGVAALVRAKHPNWTPQQVVAQLEQTAERSIPGKDNRVGWGVIDPVKALTDDQKPVDRPHPSGGVSKAQAPTPAKVTLGESPQDRQERLATYAVVGGGVLVAIIFGSALVYRDWRRRVGRVGAE